MTMSVALPAGRASDNLGYDQDSYHAKACWSVLFEAGKLNAGGGMHLLYLEWPLRLTTCSMKAKSLK